MTTALAESGLARAPLRLHHAGEESQRAVFDNQNRELVCMMNLPVTHAVKL